MVPLIIGGAAIGLGVAANLREKRSAELLLRLHETILHGECERALAEVRTTRLLGFAPPIKLHRLILEAQALSGLSRVDEGRAILAELSRYPMARHRWWFWLNDTINGLITKGMYTEALALEDFATPDYRYGQTTEDVHIALIEINLAEAEYNLGRWEAALQRMAGLDGSATKEGITRAGLNLQRAWILAHLGRGTEAWSCAERITAEELPEDFRTERHYSRAAAHLACGHVRQARQDVEDGLAIVRRPSSERNGWFLMARLAAVEEKWQDAADWCERAASHRFRFQGSDGLLLWGDVLTKLNRPDEARKAWQLAVERDPQGECANMAAQRLVESEARIEAVGT